MSSDAKYRPPRHFTLVIGRIVHVAIGAHCRTLCGRSIGDHPTRRGLTAEESAARADCKTCRSVIRPAGATREVASGEGGNQ